MAAPARLQRYGPRHQQRRRQQVRSEAVEAVQVLTAALNGRGELDLSSAVLVAGEALRRAERVVLEADLEWGSAA